MCQGTRRFVHLYVTIGEQQTNKTKAGSKRMSTERWNYAGITQPGYTGILVHSFWTDITAHEPTNANMVWSFAWLMCSCAHVSDQVPHARCNRKPRHNRHCRPNDEGHRCHGGKRQKDVVWLMLYDLSFKRFCISVYREVSGRFQRNKAPNI